MPNDASLIARSALPIETRAASFQPSTADADARTIDVVWTTGARGLRRSFWDDDFEEELVVDATSVRMDRLNSGAAPVLDSHYAYDLSGQIGVIQKAWLDGGTGYATLRFSMRDDVTPVWNDILAGIIRSTSVGYAIYRREIQERAGQPDLHRITDWKTVEQQLSGIMSIT